MQSIALDTEKLSFPQNDTLLMHSLRQGCCLRGVWNKYTALKNYYLVTLLHICGVIPSPQLPQTPCRVSILLQPLLEFVFQEQSYSSLHSGQSLVWDHFHGNIDDPCRVLADFCGVIANPCGVIADPWGDRRPRGHRCATPIGAGREKFRRDAEIFTVIIKVRHRANRTMVTNNLTVIIEVMLIDVVLIEGFLYMYIMYIRTTRRYNLHTHGNNIYNPKNVFHILRCNVYTCRYDP